MKNVLLLFALFIAVIPCSTQERQLYGFGGFSLFDEEFETGVGDGAGFRVGLGFQFNERFGIEGFLDRAPEISPDTILRSFGRTVNSYNISTVGNTYVSVGGTLTFPFNNKVSGIVKAGISNYAAELDSFIVDEIDYCALGECDNRGTDVFFSGGLIFQMQKNTSIEFSFTQFNGDAEALTLGSIFRYHF